MLARGALDSEPVARYKPRMPNDTASALNEAANVAGTVASVLAPSGVPGIIAAITAIGLRTAADAARAGLDPVEHIRRIHEADPVLAPIRAEFDRVIRENFPPQSEPPPARDTLPSSGGKRDPYEP